MFQLPQKHLMIKRIKGLGQIIRKSGNHEKF